MLKDYILTQLAQAQEENRLLKAKLAQLCEEEAKDNKKIENLLENQDVGLELFSPRNIDNKVNEQIREIRERINQNQAEQKNVTEQLSKCAENIENWQTLLGEAKGNPDQPDDQKEDNTSKQVSTDGINSSSIGREELEHILRDLDLILSLLKSDHAACEKQIMQTRYYLMALLSRQN